MKNRELTPFGLAIKTKILALGMKQEDLSAIISEKTGMFVDSAYISNICVGERNPPKIITAIREILDLPEQNQDIV